MSYSFALLFLITPYFFLTSQFLLRVQFRPSRRKAIGEGEHRAQATPDLDESKRDRYGHGCDIMSPSSIQDPDLIPLNSKVILYRDDETGCESMDASDVKMSETVFQNDCMSGGVIEFSTNPLLLLPTSFPSSDHHMTRLTTSTTTTSAHGETSPGLMSCLDSGIVTSHGNNSAGVNITTGSVGSISTSISAIPPRMDLLEHGDPGGFLFLDSSSSTSCTSAGVGVPLELMNAGSCVSRNLFSISSSSHLPHHPLLPTPTHQQMSLKGSIDSNSTISLIPSSASESSSHPPVVFPPSILKKSSVHSSQQTNRVAGEQDIQYEQETALTESISNLFHHEGHYHYQPEYEPFAIDSGSDSTFLTTESGDGGRERHIDSFHMKHSPSFGTTLISSEPSTNFSSITGPGTYRTLPRMPLRREQVITATWENCLRSVRLSI